MMWGLRHAKLKHLQCVCMNTGNRWQTCASPVDFLRWGNGSDQWTAKRASFNFAIKIACRPYETSRNDSNGSFFSFGICTSYIWPESRE